MENKVVVLVVNGVVRCVFTPPGFKVSVHALDEDDPTYTQDYVRAIEEATGLLENY